MFGRLEAVVNLYGAPDELIAARALHAVNAHVRAPDADRILGSPRARRVVFGRDQTMARIERRRHRGAQVHVPKPQHQVARTKYDVLHRLFVGQAIDAPNELDVARGPGGVLAHDLRVLFDREARLWVVPRQRHVDDARGDVDRVDRRQLTLGARKHIEQAREAELLAVEVDLERADARRQIHDSGKLFLPQPLHQRMHSETQL